MHDPIADRFAVQDVMNRYAPGVDTRDLDLYESCFDEEVVVSGFGEGEPFRGRAAWMGWVRGALERFAATQHLISNHVVAVDGDTATMRTYVQATHVLAADPTSTMTLWAVYHDVLARDGAGWRITDHRLQPIGNETRRSETRATAARS